MDGVSTDNKNGILLSVVESGFHIVPCVLIVSDVFSTTQLVYYSYVNQINDVFGGFIKSYYYYLLYFSKTVYIIYIMT